MARMAGWLLAGLVGIAGLASLPALACGGKEPCLVEGGDYRIVLPAGASRDAPVGAIVYFHGHRGSADAVVANKSFLRVAKTLGVALLAPNGRHNTWAFPNAPSRHRDEIAFVDRVLDDALQRFPLDPDRLVATGFSIGGTMSWYLACYRGERFAGFAPIAGAFWRPHPESCPSRPPVITHVHGTADKVVPMTGRPIGNRAHQGDVRQGIAFWRNRRGCSVPSATPMETYSNGRLQCERSPACGGGQVELCLHDGGHSIRAEWVERGWRQIIGP